MSATNSSTIRLKWSAMSRDDHESPDCDCEPLKHIYIHIYMCEHTAFSPHAVLCERVDVTLKMLASKGIVPIRRNHREPRHLAQPIFMLIELKEDQNGHAPNDAILDGFVELGRFLLKQASSECYLGARRDGEGWGCGVFTPWTL